MPIHRLPADYPLTDADQRLFGALSAEKKSQLTDLQIALQKALLHGRGSCMMGSERKAQRGIHCEIGGTAVIPIEIYAEDPEGSNLLSKILYRMIEIEKDGTMDEGEEYPSGYGPKAVNLLGLYEMVNRAITHFEGIAAAGPSRIYDRSCAIGSLYEMKRVIEEIIRWYNTNILRIVPSQA